MKIPIDEILIEFEFMDDSPFLTESPEDGLMVNGI